MASVRVVRRGVPGAELEQEPELRRTLEETPDPEIEEAEDAEARTRTTHCPCCPVRIGAIDSYSRGTPTQDVAATAGVGTQTILKWVRDAGIAAGHGGRRVAVAKRMLAAGVTLEEVLALVPAGQRAKLRERLEGEGGEG